jgi:hypothetical protein
MCTYDSEDFKDVDRLFIKVEDAGTPGTNGVYIGWTWGFKSSSN